MDNQFRAFFIAVYSDGKIVGFGEGTDGITIKETLINTTTTSTAVLIKRKMRILERYAYYINQMPIKENRRDALKAIFQKL
jgi:hypothetical protein